MKFPIFAPWRLCVKFRSRIFDKLTQKSQEALQDAQRIARERSQQEMDREHLLLALLGQQQKPRAGTAGTPDEFIAGQGN